MFAWPDYWWLLALAVAPQAVFVVRLAISGRSGTSTHAAGGDAPDASDNEPARRIVPRWALLLLCAGAAIGVVYGAVQRDAVFILGQVCVLVAVVVRNRIAAQENQ